MAGDAGLIEKLKKGYKAIGRTYKNHLDGYDLLPYLTGQGQEEPAQVLHVSERRRRRARHALRQLEGRVHGAALPRHAAGVGGAIYAAPVPKLFNLRTDPYEFADVTSNTYYDWFLHHVYHPVRRLAVGAEWAGDVQGFSAGPEAEQLHARSGIGRDARCGRGDALTGGGANEMRAQGCRLPAPVL